MCPAHFLTFVYSKRYESVQTIFYAYVVYHEEKTAPVVARLKLLHLKTKKVLCKGNSLHPKPYDCVLFFLLLWFPFFLDQENTLEKWICQF